MYWVFIIVKIIYVYTYIVIEIEKNTHQNVKTTNRIMDDF